jgi:hypothetical protein
MIFPHGKGEKVSELFADKLAKVSKLTIVKIKRLGS